MEIKLDPILLEEVKGEVNLFLWNSNYPIESMKVTNELIERLKNAKIIIN